MKDSIETHTSKLAKTAAGRAISLDAWAVLLALALALLIWAGWIKNVPW